MLSSLDLDQAQFFCQALSGSKLFPKVLESELNHETHQRENTQITQFLDFFALFVTLPIVFVLKMLSAFIHLLYTVNPLYKDTVCSKLSLTLK